MPWPGADALRSAASMTSPIAWLQVLLVRDGDQVRFPATFQQVLSHPLISP